MIKFDTSWIVCKLQTKIGWLMCQVSKTPLLEADQLTPTVREQLVSDILHYVTFFSTFRFTSFNVKLGDFILLCFTGFLKLLFLFGGISYQIW